MKRNRQRGLYKVTCTLDFEFTAEQAKRLIGFVKSVAELADITPQFHGDDDLRDAVHEILTAALHPNREAISCEAAVMLWEPMAGQTTSMAVRVSGESK